MRRSPTLEGLEVSSQGRRLFGGLYLAGGSEPAPAAVLLHGLPGHEQNLDLAQRLRALGISVAFFHYRGSWGSEGSYALNHALPDARAVVAWMLNRPDVDPERLAVIGLSFGGWVGFQMAADEPRIRCLVAISPLIDPLDPTGRLTPELASHLRRAPGWRARRAVDGRVARTAIGPDPRRSPDQPSRPAGDGRDGRDLPAQALHAAEGTPARVGTRSVSTS